MKEAVMLRALWAKFTQYAELAKKLVNTGSAQIIEVSPHDAYWGSGPDGSGKNRLGQLIMTVRADLTNEE